jgi:hypothetical protein
MRLRRRKVYLRERYGGEIAAGNAHDILKVIMEDLGDGTRRFFVFATGAQAETLKNSNLTVSSAASEEIEEEESEYSI